MSVTIPTTQSAAVKQGSGLESTAPVTQIAVPQPGEHEILVKITYSGVCGTDKSFLLDEFATTSGAVMQPASQGIAGHEGAGIVVAVHPSVGERWKVGDRAGIKWVTSTCGICEFCTNGRDEVHCKSQKNSGFTTPGTFQQYCVTDSRYATHLPDGVSDEEAGPIMCGGVTAYVATKRANARVGQWIVVLGAGGGLGHLGIQYARAMGLRVIAVDGGDEKEELCKKLGAEVFLDYTKVDDLAKKVHEITTYGAHAVTVFAAAKTSYALAPMLLRPSGTMVVVGIPADPSAIAGGPPALIAMRQLNIIGSVTGTLKDVEEALDLTARGLVKPILVRANLSDVTDIINRIKQGKLAGRAVLKVAD